MNTDRFKVGDLVTFVYSKPEKVNVYDIRDSDPWGQVNIIRKAYARRVLKVRDGEVQVNFDGRKMYISTRNVQKIWS